MPGTACHSPHPFVDPIIRWAIMLGCSGTLHASPTLPVNHVKLEHNTETKTVDVHIRGDHFTTYHYGGRYHMPFLWPVIGEGGTGLTRNFPMGKDEPAINDHPHHLSLYLTYGDLNGVDFWHANRENSGRIVVVEVETGATTHYRWIRTRNQWRADRDGNPIIMEEDRELRFHDGPASCRWFDIITTFHAVHGEVTFGDTKEGMLAVRMAPALDGDRGGVLTNAHGQQGEANVYGKPSPWMDYTGRIEAHGKRGIAIFDHPKNPFPAQWHVRNYGLAALNPFGTRSIAKLADGDHILPQGQSFTLRYRILVHGGSHQEAGVAGHYAGYLSE